MSGRNMMSAVMSQSRTIWNHATNGSAHRSAKEKAKHYHPTPEQRVDAYAQRLLERQAADGGQASPPDDSLGSYVTALLRMADVPETTTLSSTPSSTSTTATTTTATATSSALMRVTDLVSDWESLVELLQEHCGVSAAVALDTLQQIAQAVWSGQVPEDDLGDKDATDTAAAAAAAASAASALLFMDASELPPPSLSSSSSSPLLALQQLQRALPVISTTSQHPHLVDHDDDDDDDHNAGEPDVDPVADLTVRSSINNNLSFLSSSSQTLMSPRNLIPGNLLDDSIEDGGTVTVTVTATATTAALGLTPRNLSQPTAPATAAFASSSEPLLQSPPPQLHHHHHPSPYAYAYPPQRQDDTDDTALLHNKENHQHRSVPTTATAIAPLVVMDEESFPPLAAAIRGMQVSSGAGGSKKMRHQANFGNSTSNNRKSTTSSTPNNTTGNGDHNNSNNHTTTTTTTASTTTTVTAALQHQQSQEIADQLAAALFRPTSTRSRQSSIDESNSSNQGNSKSFPTSAGIVLEDSVAQQQQQQGLANAFDLVTDTGEDVDSAAWYEEEQYHYVASILLSMYGPGCLSLDAALAAARLAKADYVAAQYFIDAAVAAKPICRHLLQAGCYRSDCQYSHDLEGHSCLFWLRGRCSKGAASCRFLHGFHPRLMKEYLDQQPAPELQQLTAATPIEAQYVDEVGSSRYPPSNGTTMMTNGTADGGYAATAASVLPSTATKTTSTVTATLSSATTSSSFANIASQGYNMSSSFVPSNNSYVIGNLSPAAGTLASSSSSSLNNGSSHNINTALLIQQLPTVKIPQDLWNPHENRDANAFYIADPIERYWHVRRHRHAVAAMVPASSQNHQHHHANNSNNHSAVVSSSASSFDDNIIDLHFQSTKTFAIVLEQVLPEMLQHHDHVWIVTGTGHHVGSRTHQRSGGALERAVLEWLVIMSQQQPHQQHPSLVKRIFRGRDRNGQGGAILVQR